MAVITGTGTITGTDADDSITGSGGNDTLIGGGGSDTLDGAGGWNIVAYWSSPNAVGVQLGRGLTSNDGFGGSDVLLNIHGAFGSAFGDVLLGSDFSDLLNGLNGDDTIQGEGGDDALVGFAGNDVIDGGAGNDTAYYGGNRADYTFTTIAGGFTVTHNGTFDSYGTPTNEGTDTVTNVEFFQFADGVFSAAEVLNPSANRPTAGDDSLTGTARGDRIDALAGNDTVNGGDGDDTLIGGAGDDRLDGGAGHDIADMGSAGFRGAHASVSGGVVTLTSAAGTDTLTNIEEVRFADGRLVFDAADPAAQVVRLYVAALDRAPDQGGLNYWIDAVQHGQALSGLASGFIASSEFQTRFGGATASNGAFVDQLYHNVLGREGEAAGRAFWVDSLDRGAGRADVLTAFSESAENKAGTDALVKAGIWDRSEAADEVARLYDTVFNRLPDAPGLQSWKAALEGGGMTLAQVADGFTASTEFKAQYGALDNRHFADALYTNTLDRASDKAGLDYWTGQLDAGAARSAVVLAFSESQEHVALTAHNVGGETPNEYGVLFL